MPSWVVSLPDRLDVFLASGGRSRSRSQAQKSIENGKVRVNDEVQTRMAFRLQEGDVVELTEEAPTEQTSLSPEDLHLEVLYEDDASLVLQKPAGFAVHPGTGMAPGEKTILHGIAFLFEKRGLPFSEAAVLVHRLDKDTTGCLLVAKNPEAHRILQEQFETRTVRKQYLAVVAGVPALAAATVDAPIGRSAVNRTKMAVSSSVSSREAQTTYRTLSSSRAPAALLLCDLHTGRTHQIRVHLHSIGHPVLGDPSYANDLAERLNGSYDIRQILLHAWTLKFVSPADQKEHEVHAPLSSDWSRVLERLELKWPQA